MKIKDESRNTVSMASKTFLSLIILFPIILESFWKL